MLVQLSIRDIVLIDQLDLELGSGLTILTGETGAGKSILLDAFALTLGARGDSGLVRQGQTQGQVTAVFDVPLTHPAILTAQENGITLDGDLILRRVQMADGRTRAFVNDQPVSVQALRKIGAALVEIHGQHDDRAMVEPAKHRALIDVFGGLGAEVSAVRAAYAHMMEMRSLLAAEEERIAKARADQDYLRHAHDELSQLQVQVGEETDLSSLRSQMQQAEKVSTELREAHEVLNGDQTPTALLFAVLRRLERRSAQAPALIEPSVKAIDKAIEALEVAGQTLDQALRDAQFDPRELERIEERLFALRAAARKYNVPCDQLPVLAAQFEKDLTALDAGEAHLVQLAQDLRKAEAAYAAVAQALSAQRQQAAQQLDHFVNAELPPLKLERARFMSEIKSDDAQAGPEGIDHIEFWVQTNPGTRPGPLMAVASGGELARFMLALKVALAHRGSAPTLVFDEIDTGVGGAVADAIGQRLARLADKVQVLAVTHAPQVAARAMGHFQIAKGASAKGAKDQITTRVIPLGDDARREEIARMLSGAKITDEARAAARRLLQGVD